MQIANYLHFDWLISFLNRALYILWLLSWLEFSFASLLYFSKSTHLAWMTRILEPFLLWWCWIVFSLYKVAVFFFNVLFKISKSFYLVAFKMKDGHIFAGSSCVIHSLEGIWKILVKNREFSVHACFCSHSNSKTVRLNYCQKKWVLL